MSWAYIGSAAVAAIGSVAAAKNSKVNANVQSGAPTSGGDVPGTGPMNVAPTTATSIDSSLAGLPSIGELLQGLDTGGGYGSLGSNVQPSEVPTQYMASATQPTAAPTPAPEAPKTPDTAKPETPATPEKPAAGWGEVLSTAAKVMGNPVIQQLLMGAPQTRAQTAAPLAGGQVNPQVMQSFGLNRGGVGQLLAQLPRIGGR